MLDRPKNTAVVKPVLRRLPALIRRAANGGKRRTGTPTITSGTQRRESCRSLARRRRHSPRPMPRLRRNAAAAVQRCPVRPADRRLRAPRCLLDGLPPSRCQSSAKPPFPAAFPTRPSIALSGTLRYHRARLSLAVVLEPKNIPYSVQIPLDPHPQGCKFVKIYTLRWHASSGPQPASTDLSIAVTGTDDTTNTMSDAHNVLVTVR